MSTTIVDFDLKEELGNAAANGQGHTVQNARLDWSRPLLQSLQTGVNIDFHG